MALKVILSGEAATDTAFDLIVADYPLNSLVLLRPEHKFFTRAGSSYGGSPDLTVKVEPLQGRYVHFKARISAPAGTSTIKLALKTGALAEDILMELATAGTTPTLVQGTAAVTSLATNGNAQGVSSDLNVYVKNSSAGTVTVTSLAIMTGDSAANADYLT